MKQVPLSLACLEKGSGKPLYMQICDTLRQQIIAGYLAPGTRLPFSRNYAIEIGVSRTSVVAAFEQLQAEGYINSRQGSGSYVTPMGRLDVVEQGHVNPESKNESFNWATLKPNNQSGAADMRLFPYRQWARCVANEAREVPESLVQVIDPFGDRPLRESISRYLPAQLSLHPAT